MRAFHDSLDIEFRSPFGAVAAGNQVTLALNVYDAPGASAKVRTWVEGTGEQLYDMHVVEGGAPQGETTERQNVVRYEATIAPQEAGIVWYHFVITDAQGATRRYGSADGKTGGVGQLVDWEPPSYKLSVLESEIALMGAQAYTDAGAPRGFNHLETFPFPQALVAYLRGEATAHDLADTIDALRENQPPKPFLQTGDPLDAYQRASLIAQLGEEDGNPHTTFAARASAQPDEGRCGLAKGRLWCASLLIALMPGSYPLERGFEGAGAACSCPAHPWGCASRDCDTIARNAVDIRRMLPLFDSGDFSCFAANDDVFGFWRCDADSAVCVLVNASPSNVYDVPVPLKAESASELIGGYEVPLVDTATYSGNGSVAGIAAQGNAAPERCALAHLNQLGSCVLYFHPAKRLNRPMEPGLGVLAHITSLPMDAPDLQDGAQDVLADAQAATEEGEADAHLAQCMRAVEAVLGDSGLSADYVVEQATRALRPNGQDFSAQHGGTMGAPARAFIDWLAEAGMRYWQVLPVNPTDEFGSPYAGISAFAGNARLLEGNPVAIIRHLAAFEDSEGYQEFCEREADWLEPYVGFMAIRQKMGTRAFWQEWPEEFLHYDPELIEGDRELRFYAGAWRRAQYAFERQWKDLRAYANEHGILVIGDMPIYVSADSADVWAHPELFQLDPDGKPAVVAGCPPDSFAADGQIWGNPVYDWDAARQDGYQWWLRRLERAFGLYDLVRLDHFIGFAQYYAIPAGEKATAGTYRPGPGLELFEKAHERFGSLPIIAEDLGLVTPGVRTLSATCGFPGMDIIQFADGGDPLAGYRPRPEKVVYTGTHDNQTLVGYACERYPELDAIETAESLMDAVVTSPAPVAIVPLQDILELGDDARMNVPGVAEGNWSWQAESAPVQLALNRARELVERNADAHGGARWH